MSLLNVLSVAGSAPWATCSGFCTKGCCRISVSFRLLQNVAGWKTFDMNLVGSEEQLLAIVLLV